MKERFQLEKTPIFNAGKTSRRNLLAGAASLGIVTAAGIQYRNEQLKQNKTVTNTSEADGESVSELYDGEMMPEEFESPVFERVLKARELQFGGLKRTEVVFIDEFGRQLTEAWPLTDSVGLTPEDMTWRYEGGGPAGIPGTWTKEQIAYIREEFAKQGIELGQIGMLHVYEDLDKTAQADMESVIESVYVNAHKPVESDPGERDAFTILNEECNFTTIPPRIAAMLKPAMIGIAAEESRFNSGLVSSRGAEGMLQVMPGVAKKYAENNHIEHFDSTNLSNQILVAIDHIEMCYRSLTKNLAKELAYFTEVYFYGNTASMEKYMLVPLILNSYNVGQEKVIDAVQWFTEKYFDPEDAALVLGRDEKLSGYDPYQAIVYAADEENSVDRFGDDSSNYVEKVMGWQRAYEEYELKLLETELASN